jgi:hypothetical protein
MSEPRPHISSFNYGSKYYKHVLVPLQMCNYVVQNNIEKPFRLFVLLKLELPSGKMNWNVKTKTKLAKTLGVTPKTIYNHFKKLNEFGGINYDSKFKYWRLKSFERIRLENDWILRRAYPFSKNDLKYIYAVLGAVLYTQLFKSYLRKHKRGSSNVLKSASAHKSNTSFKIKKEYAEISVIGVSKIFNLSINKSVRLKQEAQIRGYLLVKKQYTNLNWDQVYVVKKGKKLSDETINVVFKNGSYRFQLIDRIHSKLYFKKRKKLETL